MTEQFRRTLRDRFRSGLDRLSPVHTSQAGLERLLGLSPGYLCHLKRGVRTPSVALVSILGFIALDPAARLRELESYWARDQAPDDEASGT